jgi:hypothetical protein
MDEVILATRGAGSLSSHLCARSLDQARELLYIDEFYL